MPGNLQAVQVTKQPQRIQTWLVGNQSFLLVNPDILNQIFIGNDPGSQPIPIPALGSITLTPDSKHDVWISTGGVNATVSALLLPNGSNWTPSPAQVAAQINALGLAKDTTVQGVNTTLGSPAQNATVAGVTTAVNGTPQSTAALIASGSALGTAGGVPLLRFTNTISQNTFSINAGTTQVLASNIPINQPGYEGFISVYLPSASGTLPFCTLMFQWNDSASGLSVDTEEFVLSSGNGSANAIPYYISGPCHGDNVTISLKNNDPGFTLTVTYAINQTSHVYLRDRILQSTYPTVAPNGFTWPNGVPTPGAIFETQPTVGPSGTVDRLIAVWNGIIWVTLDNSGLANGVVATFVDASGLLSGTTTTEIGAVVVAAGARIMQQMAFPSGPVLVHIHNQGTTGNTTTIVNGIKQEY